MNREQKIERILQAWKRVQRIQAKPVEFQDEYDFEEDERMNEDDRQERLLLQGEASAYDSDTLINGGRTAPRKIEITEESVQDYNTDALRIRAYEILFLRLVGLDALEIALDTIRELDESSRNQAVMEIIETLAERGQQGIAWTAVDRLFDCLVRPVDVAMSIPATTRSPADLGHAQRLVEREAERAWRSPDRRRKRMAVSYWLRLWEAGRVDDDLRRARELCKRLEPESRCRTYSNIAFSTRAEEDFVNGFAAARLIPDRVLQADLVHGIIRTLAGILLLNNSSEFVERARRIARAIPEPRWRSLLLEKTGITLESP